MTTNMCDMNCCCDTDCTNEVLRFQGDCLKQTNLVTKNPICNLVFANKVPDGVQKYGGIGSMCVVSTNSKITNFKAL